MRVPSDPNQSSFPGQTTTTVAPKTSTPAPTTTAVQKSTSSNVTPTTVRDRYSEQRQQQSGGQAPTSEHLLTNDKASLAPLPKQFTTTLATGLRSIVANAESYYPGKTIGAWRAITQQYLQRDPVAQQVARQSMGTSQNPVVNGQFVYGDAIASWQPLAQAELFGNVGNGQQAIASQITQGYIGDCYLLSTLAGLAAQYPGFLEEMITYDPEKGTYLVRLFNMEPTGDDAFGMADFDPGAPVYIEIDPSVLLADDLTSPGAAITDWDGDGIPEIGIALIEKAFAVYNDQLKAQGYDLFGAAGQSGIAGIEGGYADWAFEALTGASADYVGVQAYDPLTHSMQRISNDDIMQTLDIVNDGGFAVAGSLSAEQAAQAGIRVDGNGIMQPSGIVTGHAYTVLGTVTIGGNDFIALRNPWGLQEGTSNPDGVNDGIFLMSVDEFALTFGNISVQQAPDGYSNNGLPDAGSSFASAMQFYVDICTGYTGTSSITEYARGLEAAHDGIGQQIPDISDVPNPGVVSFINSNMGNIDMGRWASFIGSSGDMSGVDVGALVQFVLRESYTETTKDLQFYAQKVRFFNELKQNIRDETSRLRGIQADLAPYFKEDGSVDMTALRAADPDLATQIDKALDTTQGGGVNNFSTMPGPNGEVVLATDDPKHPELSRGNFNRWDTDKGVQEKLDTTIKAMEEKLNSVGDDAQLANVDLQNMLQKQQQVLQMMSNISKMMFDTAMSIIRKIG